jgi:hypothetical protein
VELSFVVVFTFTSTFIQDNNGIRNGKSTPV